IVLMLVTLALAPGVVANLVLKEHWGRPRPIDVAEFGGDEHFRPWWDPRGDCPKNCSFVAGEPSGAFWTMAGAAVVPPQWRALGYGGALAFGAAVGGLRMAAGAHFFSDVGFAAGFRVLVILLRPGWPCRLPTRPDAGGGGTGDRADWAKASLGTRSDSILPLGLQAEHELPIHASGGVPIEADVRGGRVRVAPGALQRLLQEQALPPGREEQRVDGSDQ